MNNSTNKWPEGYKGFTSAVSPGAPYLMIDLSGNIANLSWKIIFNDCLPVNSFNIYKNDQFIQSVPYTTTSISSIVCSLNTFYVTSVSGINESEPSNTVNVYNPSSFSVTNGTYTSSGGIYTVTFIQNG
jgi:hypothetical protein